MMMTVIRSETSKARGFVLTAAVIAALLLGFTGPSFAKKGGNGGRGNGGGEDPPPTPPPLYVVSATWSDDVTLNGMNDHGDVVGNVDDANGQTYAAFWPAGSSAPINLNDYIDPATGYELVYANAINNVGQIAGWLRDNSRIDEDPPFQTYTSYRLTLSDPPILDYLGTPTVSLISRNGINDYGDVVADNIFGDGSYVYTDEFGLRSLGDLRPQAINNLGQITGNWRYSSSLGSPWFAFLYSVADDSWDIVPRRAIYSFGKDINDLGELVGGNDFGKRTREGWHAFRWSAADGAVDLGTLGGETSVARAINHNGFIVGYSSKVAPAEGEPEPTVAFLHFDGQMYELLAEAADGGVIVDGALPAGWDQATVSYAWQVNDLNQITGEIQFADGSTESFLLTPVVP